MSADIDDLPDVTEPEYSSGEYERLTERGLTRAHVVRDVRRVVGHCGSARAAAESLDLGVSTVFNLMSGNSAVGPRVLDQLYGTEGGELPAKWHCPPVTAPPPVAAAPPSPPAVNTEAIAAKIAPLLHDPVAAAVDMLRDQHALARSAAEEAERALTEARQKWESLLNHRSRLETAIEVLEGLAA